MTDRDLTHDMGDVLDGVATAAQAERLERALKTDPTARALFRELKEIDGLLRQVPGESPPAAMKDEILSALEARRRRSMPEGWLATLRSALARRPGLACGYSFAAGLAFGVMFFLTWPRGGMTLLKDAGRSSATMIRHAGDPGRSGTIPYRNGTVTYQAETGTASSDLRLRVSGGGDVEIILKGITATHSAVHMEVQAAGEARHEEIRLDRRDGE